MRDRVISSKFSTHRVSKQCTLGNFQKIFLSPKLAAILNFPIFAKNAKTPEDICRVYWQLFYKNRFPATFGNPLEFLRKKAFISETVWDRVISTGICWVYWWLFTKSLSRHLVAILNFYGKCKNAFILGTRFWLPPWTLMEIENIIYLKNPQR